MRFKPLDFLIDGEILAENLVNINNQTLLKKNATLTAKIAERIKNLGFKSVYTKMPDEEDILEEEVKDIINPEIRRKAIFDVKECIDTFQSQISTQKQALVYGDTGQGLVQTLGDVSDSLIEELMSSDDLKVSIMDIKSESHYMYEHAINTAVLSIMISLKMGLSSKDMRNIAIAALLANIGYTQIPSTLYDHERPLDEAAWQEVKQHPRISYDILTNNTNLNAHIKSMVIQHHERIDGSGYPFGIPASALHPYSKIVMVADVYDAMTSDRKYRLAHPHNEALEYIMANAGKLFDFEVTRIFSRCIVPFPAGSYVKLSDGTKAIVLRNNPSHPMRPVLRAFKHGLLDTSPEGYIDLMTRHNLTILGIVFE